MLIFAKFAGNKPATLLKYELLSAVLRTLNLDKKKPFFGRSSYLSTASVYIRQLSKRWIKSFFVSRSTTKKMMMMMMMMTMYNAKTEYGKMMMYKKLN